MDAGYEISGETFRSALLVAGERVGAVRDELCALDARAGDGDLGTTLASGFAQAQQVLATADPDDIGAMLAALGHELATKAPSTMGALLATAFMRAGRELAATPTLTGLDVVLLLEAAARGVAERGGASSGQRTVLDAMVPAATAARATVDAGGGAAAALRAASHGAAEGAAATEAMEPQHGRAGWIRERARGNKDAGAAAWAVFVDGLADGVATESGMRPAAQELR